MSHSKRLREAPSVGRTLDEEQIAALIREGRFHSVSLRLPCDCNLHCPYCYSGIQKTGWGRDSTRLRYDEIIGLLEQAFELGVETVSVVGDGEPLMYRDGDSDVFSLLSYLQAKAKRSVLFTNGTLVKRDDAKALYELGATVIAKQNSANMNVQDNLAGRSLGKMMLRGLDYLCEAGLAEELRLGVHTVVCKSNYDEIPDLWRSWRKSNIVPYVQICVPPYDKKAQTKFGQEISVPSADVRDLFHELLNIDQREFGFSWDPDYTYPIAGLGCTVVLTGFGVTPKGDVQMCAYVENPLGNIRQETLKNILSKDAVRKIKGFPYGDSRKKFHYGCRALTHAITGDRFASDPFWWGESRDALVEQGDR